MNIPLTKTFTRTHASRGRTAAKAAALFASLIIASCAEQTPEVTPQINNAVVDAVVEPDQSALGANTDFLPVDEAFRIDLGEEQDEVVVIWSIAPDYYLYKHKFKLAWLPENGERVALDDAASFSRGLGKTDDYFGHVEVFYHQALARIPRHALGSSAGELELAYQGCADAGLCYPVQTRTLALSGK